MDFTEITLTSVPSPTLNGLFCPTEAIIFSCIGVAIPLVLDWRINNTYISTYVYEYGAAYPLAVESTVPGTMVSVINATMLTSFHINVISELKISSLHSVRKSNIQCSSQTSQSNNIHIQFKESPSSPQMSFCSWTSSQDLRIQWLQNSSSRYNQDTIHVNLSLSLSIEFVSMWTNAGEDMLFNLTQNSKFFLSATGVNCNNQTGPVSKFFIYVARPISSIFKSKILYGKNSLHIERITISWNWTELANSHLSNVVDIHEKKSFSDLIQVTIEEVYSGEIILNVTFLQNSTSYCDSGLKCSIFSNILGTRNATYYITAHAVAPTNRSVNCSVPNNIYEEEIASSFVSMVGMTLTPKRNEVILQCYSYIDLLSHCVLQYTKGWDYELSIPVKIPVNKNISIPINQSVIYTFYIQIPLSSTVEYVIQSSYRFVILNKKDLIVITEVPDSVRYMVKDTNFYIVVISQTTAALIILFVCGICVICNVVLLCKVKNIRIKKSITGESLSLKAKSSSDVPTTEVEVVYDELLERHNPKNFNTKSHQRYIPNTAIEGCSLKGNVAYRCGMNKET